MKINLIVIKTHQIERIKNFYEQLGMNFVYHQHANGPKHYSTEIEKVVFEIYPLNGIESDGLSSLRLGFDILNLDKLISKLVEKNVKLIAKAKNTEWGYVAVIEDPDGRKIELKEKNGSR